jgi:hypothetical protein
MMQETWTHLICLHSFPDPSFIWLLFIKPFIGPEKLHMFESVYLKRRIRNTLINKTRRGSVTVRK